MLTRGGGYSQSLVSSDKGCDSSGCGQLTICVGGGIRSGCVQLLTRDGGYNRSGCGQLLTRGGGCNRSGCRRRAKSSGCGQG
jgi:hypothetical protein